MASEQTINSFLMTNGSYFSSSQIPYIRHQLESLPDERIMVLMGLDYQSTTTLLLISIFVGSLGIDRILLGQYVSGVLKLFTGGGCGIWWLIDLFLISDMTKQSNYKKFQEALRY